MKEVARDIDIALTETLNDDRAQTRISILPTQHHATSVTTTTCVTCG